VNSARQRTRSDDSVLGGNFFASDDEVAAVATYVRNAWGNRAPSVDAVTVAKTRHALEQRND
jgi:mono/diheme cytochrome c family protein